VFHAILIYIKGRAVVSRILTILIVTAVLVLFQNCSAAVFSSNTQSSTVPVKSHASSGFSLGGAETYDGKLTLHNYDLDLNCGPGQNGLPQIRFTLETDGTNHMIQRGPCQETTGRPFLDALPLAGAVSVDDGALIKNSFNPNMIVAHLLVFQTESSALNVGLIYEFWNAIPAAAPLNDKKVIDFMLVRKPDGSRTMTFIASRMNFVTGQIIETPYLSPELSMETVVTGPLSRRNTAIVLNSSGLETGRIVLDGDATGNSGSLSWTGDVGYQGLFPSSSVPIFTP